jgi:predicted DNA-binding transcriptional regulator YafY
MERVVDISFQYEIDEFGAELTDRERLSLVLRKVEQTLKEDDKRRIDREVYLMRFHPYVDIIDEEAYGILEDAHASRRRVQITYYSYSKGEFTTREADIYKMSRRYIIAYDYLSKEVRKFRVSRIVKAEKLTETYTIPEAGKIAHHKCKCSYSFSCCVFYPYTISLSFSIVGSLFVFHWGWCVTPVSLRF